MQIIRKNETQFSVITIFVILVFTSTGFSAGLSVGRILPKGKVSLFHGNQKIGEFSSEAPLPEDTLLSVEGQCGVKLDDLYFVAGDKSLFSMTTNTDFRKLTVKNGIVYFALSALSHTLAFQTPEAMVTTSEVMLKATSNNRLLKGYVSVEKDITRLGVLEGGSMLVMVDDGKPMTINAGHELRLAQAEIFKKEVPTEEGTTEEGPTEEGTTEEGPTEVGTTEEYEGMSTGAKVGITLGVIGTIGLAAILIGSSGSSSDDASAPPTAPAGSPAQP